MSAQDRARFMQPRYFPVLYRNKYLDKRVYKSEKDKAYDSIFFLPQSCRAARRLGFLARCKSAARERGRKTDVSNVICESCPSPRRFLRRGNASLPKNLRLGREAGASHEVTSR